MNGHLLQAEAKNVLRGIAASLQICPATYALCYQRRYGSLLQKRPPHAPVEEGMAFHDLVALLREGQLA